MTPGIPSAEGVVRFDPERITEAVAAVDASKLQPIIRKVADDLYEHILDAAQDYLCENMEGNLKSHLAMVEGQNAQMRRELYEADKLIGGNYMTGEDRTAKLRDNDAKLVGRQMLIEALEETWRVLRAAGTLNLTNGVQLGQTSWYVKICDAEAMADRALEEAKRDPSHAA